VIGQQRVRDQLGLVPRGRPGCATGAPTTCCSRPARLGKTTLAMIIATEVGAPLRLTSGRQLTHAGDLAAILSGMNHGDVLFVDEIHRMARAAEEMLYLAMEDFRVDVVIGKGRAPPRSRWRSRRSRWSAPPPAPGCCPGRCATGSASPATSSSTTPPSST
jgi:Holliday junction DNA helicase RuvB